MTSDVTIFAIGSVVFIIAVTGAWTFVYARYFRPAFLRQNNPAARAVERRSGRPGTGAARDATRRNALP